MKINKNSRGKLEQNKWGWKCNGTARWDFSFASMVYVSNEIELNLFRCINC